MGGYQRAVRAPQINFQVTPDIIAQSIPKDSSHCMIADALKAAMPNAEYVSVDLATIRFTDRAAGRRYIYLTPRSAQDALIAFDQGEKPEPFMVKAAASQMIKTGTARRAPKIKNDDNTSVPDAPNTRRKTPRATLVPTGAGGNTIPIKDGGTAPPIGPLAKGTTGRSRSGRTTRRREFGLRALIR